MGTPRRLSVLGIIVTLALFGVSFAVPSARAQDGTPVGAGGYDALVDVGGRNLHVACTGDGPTVLFEQGSAGPVGGTAAVAEVGPLVSQALGAQFCSYDRAGTGQSDPDPTDGRTFVEAAADFATVMALPEVACPCVVIGESMGGSIALIALAADPAGFAGLVLLDAPYPGYWDDFTGLAPAGSAEASPDFLETVVGGNEEAIDMAAGFGQVTVPAEPPALPIVVVTHGAGNPPPCWAEAPCSPTYPVVEFEAAWQAGQAALAESLGAELVVAENTGHAIATENPALVLEIAARVLAAVSAPTAATPVAAAGPPDLAAMALAPGDVPEGYFDEYSEWSVPAAALPVLLGIDAPNGLERLYQSFFASVGEPRAIHVFVLEFASDGAAEAGAGAVDGLLRPPLPDGTIIGPDHEAGPGLGEDLGTPSILTTVTYDTWAAGGPRADVVAVSFRHGRLVAGVSVERFADPPADADSSGNSATPLAADPAQKQLATDLAASLDRRIATVQAGEQPAGVDYALSAAVLPLEQLVDDSTPVFGGYKSGIDLLRCGICGEENSLGPFASGALTGVARGVVVGPLVDGEPTTPIVSVAITRFASPDDALAALTAIRQAPNDRPTAIPVPRGLKTLAADPVIPGAGAALAFTAVMDEQSPDAAADSAGVDFVAGDLLVTVDVQGGLTADAALETAVDLATQQAACLTKGESCGQVQAPAALAAGADG